MLSNCKIKSMNSGAVSFQFYGESMLNYTKDSLLSGDLLECSNEDLLSSFFNGSFNPSDTDIFVFNLSSGQLFTANVTDIDIEKDAITLVFLNPSDKKYPNLVLNYGDIEYIYRVNEVRRLLSSMNNLGPSL